jgi:Ca2+-binding RTX toxin-like protein
VGSTYSAAGWNGRIFVGTNVNKTHNGTNDLDQILGLGGNDRIDGKVGDGVDLLQDLAGYDYLEGARVRAIYPFSLSTT